MQGMKQQIIIPLEEFPEDGIQLSGELDDSIFGIDCDDVRSIGPVEYHLEAQLYETELVVRGEIAAPFRLRCMRCLGEFDYTVELDDVTYAIDVKGKLSADITEDVREDILLELPGYPKCELIDQECEINDKFGDFRLDKDPQPGVNCATPSGNSVWDALDQYPGK